MLNIKMDKNSTNLKPYASLSGEMPGIYEYLCPAHFTSVDNSPEPSIFGL